jgi:hypothetical protein
MQRARNDTRMVRLREYMLQGIQGAIELWSTDAGISEVCPALELGLCAILDVWVVLSETMLGA